MMDVDHFKEVNDTYGHLTGSKTLEEIGHCIMGAMRSGDGASRFGGEEFSAFLLDAEIGQALVAAERIRSVIQAHGFTVIRSGRTLGEATARRQRDPAREISDRPEDTSPRRSPRHASPG